MAWKDREGQKIMALQLTETNTAKAFSEFSKLIPGDEIVAAESTDVADLEAYLAELNRRGLDVYQDTCTGLQYRLRPGQSGMTRLVIFKRGRPSRGPIVR